MSCAKVSIVLQPLTSTRFLNTHDGCVSFKTSTETNVIPMLVAVISFTSNAMRPTTCLFQMRWAHICMNRVWPLVIVLIDASAFSNDTQLNVLACSHSFVTSRRVRRRATLNHEVSYMRQAISPFRVLAHMIA